MKKIIFHVDMDAFYASVETINNPELKDKPFVVGTGPNVGIGSGVVTTASYKAREYGVKSAMRISQARKLYPDLIIVPPTWKLIKETSDKVMEILKKYGDHFQQVSIDEAFIDVTKKIGPEESPIALAEIIKNEIEENIKITCSIGIAESKEVAKIASDLNKPNGITFIPIENVEEILDPLPVRKIRGIGPKKAEFLNENGIKTIADLRKLKLSELTPLFHDNKKIAQHFYKVIRGLDEGEVKSRQLRKSIGKKKNFGKAVTELDELKRGIKSTINIIYDILTKSNFYYKTISVEIVYTDFKRTNKAFSIESYSNSKKKMFETAFKLINDIIGEKFSVRGIRISISNLKKGKFQSKMKVQKTLEMWV